MRIYVLFLCFSCFASASIARESIEISGSSVLNPYVNVVANEFLQVSPEYTVNFSGGGSSAELKSLCSGLGPSSIDIAASIRPMSLKERAKCKEGGVEVIEIELGYTGFVFAYDNNGPKMSMTPAEIYQALAAERLIDGEIKQNPTRRLSDLNSALPAFNISFYVPNTAHPSRYAFDKTVMEAGCIEDGAYRRFLSEAKMNGVRKSRRAASKRCRRLRADGAVVEISGTLDGAALARVDANKQGVGVFSHTFLKDHAHKLQPLRINGVEPTYDAFISGQYPLRRSTYLYVKQDHLEVIPGLKEYTEFFLSAEMTGPNSPLVDIGFISLRDDDGRCEDKERCPCPKKVTSVLICPK